MKLEIKHIAPYLPYGLSFKDHNGDERELLTIHISAWQRGQIGIWPCLRPLSDLTKEIEVNGERFIPIEQILLGYGCIQCEATTDEERIYIYDVDEDKVIDVIDGESMHLSSYGIVSRLFEWHFDVFGLIPQGLANDINTLGK